MEHKKIRNYPKKPEHEKNKIKDLTIPFVYSVTCCRCGKKIKSDEASCAVDPEKKIVRIKFDESIFFPFYCSDCTNIYEKQDE